MIVFYFLFFSNLIVRFGLFIFSPQNIQLKSSFDMRQKHQKHQQQQQKRINKLKTVRECQLATTQLTIIINKFFKDVI